MANAIAEVIDDRNYEMREVLDDYLSYCYGDKLIPEYDSRKFLRMQLAGTTFDFNISNNVYYDNSERNFRAHNYLGLYKQKSVRAVGKICARITAIETPNGIEFKTEFGELTEEREQMIIKAMADGDSYGYNLRAIEHRYFFVEKFYETDFRKITPGGSMGTRIFDLTKILGEDKIPEVEKLSMKLREKTWT